MSIQGAGKTMKRLAREAHGVVLDSAGEMGRRQRWNLFVKNLPHDHTLLELAGEIVDEMDDQQRRQLLLVTERAIS